MHLTKWSLWSIVAATLLTTGAGCELIASVDRDKIPAEGAGGTEADAAAGGTGGTNTGGTGGTDAGTGGTAGSTGGTGGSGTGGEAGSTGGTAGSGTGGEAGSTGGTAGAGTGGEAGSTGGTAGSGSGGAAGSEGGLPCTTPADCPATNNECIVNTCDNDVCGTDYVADGTAVTTQTAGDCQKVQCDGQGGTKSAADNNDLPDDDNDCTTDTCNAGAPEYTPVASGTACGTGGTLVCDGAGACVGCASPDDCAGSDTDCAYRTCVSNTCGVHYVDDGTEITAQTANDCKHDVCDGAGNVVTRNDDTDLPASDGNVCTSEACNAGTPAHVAVTDGTTCDDSDKCTQTDTCVSGTCTGANPVTCTASNTCHTSTCVSATGACDDQPKADGVSCDDGNACTQTDTCTSGTCTGADPVTCTAQDQCHDVGTCDTATGTCSNPAKTDGTACDDSDACTQSDTCQSGACTGTAVTCTAQDQCHDVGTCDSVTGTCSNPVKVDGATCSDGDGCTTGETCQAGSCTGGTAVVCAAPDQCHGAGTCNSATGTCDYPNLTDGTTCNDSNACTQTDTCQGGVCTGASPVTCATPDQCHEAGVCDTATGTCTYANKTDGTGCDDGNACTQADSCQAGVCTGASPVTCTPSDSCHTSVCDTATGTCNETPKTNGTSCDDDNACTQTDTCQTGVCTGANPVTCTASDECHDVGTCDTATGLCSDPPLDGTSCTPAVDVCKDATTLYDYAPTASCVTGVCTTAVVEVPCIAGCDAGACKPFKLLFSEYVEGSSSNKAVEIENVGANAINLKNCQLRLYSNGAAAPTATMTLKDQSLAPGARWIVCHGSSGTGLLSKCSETNSTVINFNGDDAIDLVCGGVTQDVFGQIGNDPGSGWGSGTTLTADHTLRRLCSVTTGDAIGSDAFDPATEWAGFQQDSFDDIGTRMCVYSHTITIDGIDDFYALTATSGTDTFATSSAGYTGYVTWDATYAYLGMNGADIGGGSASKFWVIYLGGDAPTTTTGVLYNTQQPGLPFGAKYHIRWKADGTYTNAMVWDGTQWADAGWDFTGDVFRTGNFIEMRIPRADIGATTNLKMVMAMVNETNGAEWTYASVPASAVTDGVDPDYLKSFDFTMTTLYSPWAFPAL